MPGTTTHGLQYLLDLSRSRGWPLLMGVVNVTPDSFSDGGRYLSKDAAVEHALRLTSQGADILDVGGESTRPDAAEISLDEELERVIPVIDAVHKRLQIPISIDTSKPGVMRAAVEAGASLINDVRALRLPGALECAAQLNVDVVLMHMQGDPKTMQKDPQYADLLSEVRTFFELRAAACIKAGIAAEQIIIDPGFGFGKTVQHNLRLLANLHDVAASGWPVLVGVSRKSMIGGMLDRNINERLHASVALAVFAAQHGASMLRVHDVQATCDALRVTAMVTAEYRNTQIDRTQDAAQLAVNMLQPG